MRGRIMLHLRADIRHEEVPRLKLSLKMEKAVTC